MWNRNFRDNTKVARKGLLEEGMRLYRCLSMEYDLPIVAKEKYIIADRRRVGIDFGNYILVAKISLANNTISVSKKIWNNKAKKPIIIYAKADKTFYLFKQENVTMVVPGVNGDIGFAVSFGTDIKKVFHKYNEDEKYKKIFYHH